MRKIGLLHRTLAILTLFSVFTLGVLMYLPNDVVATGDTGKNIEETANPDEIAGASEALEPLDHYEPLPFEPIHQEANNVLLASGLGVAVLLIGGSIVMDRRKK